MAISQIASMNTMRFRRVIAAVAAASQRGTCGLLPRRAPARTNRGDARRGAGWAGRSGDEAEFLHERDLAVEHLGRERIALGRGAPGLHRPGPRGGEVRLREAD